MAGLDLSQLLADPRVLSTIAILVAPIAIRQSLNYISALRRPNPAGRRPLPPITHPRLFWSLLVTHSLFVVLQTVLLRPPNIFTRLGFPILTTSVATLRDAVLQGLLPSSQAPDLLLKRLQSFPLRALYVRHGHRPLSNCTYCEDEQDFMLYALAGPAVEYVLQAGFLSVLVGGWTGRKRWRPAVLVGLGAMAVGEGWVVMNVDIDLENGKPPIMVRAS